MHSFLIAWTSFCTRESSLDGSEMTFRANDYIQRYPSAGRLSSQTYRKPSESTYKSARDVPRAQNRTLLTQGFSCTRVWRRCPLQIQRARRRPLFLMRDSAIPRCERFSPCVLEVLGFLVNSHLSVDILPQEGGQHEAQRALLVYRPMCMDSRRT